MIQTLLGYDWFIAYGHADQGPSESAGQSLARALAVALRKSGYRVCIDVAEYHPGHTLSLLTRLRVGSSSHFILVLDQKAARSEWVRRELEVARARKRTLVLIDVDETFARIHPPNPIESAFRDRLRISYAAEAPSHPTAAAPEPDSVVAGTDSSDTRTKEVDVIAERLQRAFDGNRVETVERRILARSDAFAVAYEPGELLVWRRPVPLLAPRPWRLDLPRPLGPTNPPRIVLGSNALAAAFDDVAAVRVWSFSGRDQPAGVRHQGIAWLRDGRFFAWDNHTADGLRAPVSFSIGKPGTTIPDVEFAPPTTAEANGCAPTGSTDGSLLPSTAVLSRDGRRLFVLQRSDLSWVFDLENHPPRCLPLGDALREALGAAGRREVAMDEAGDWLVVTSERGTRLWSTRDISSSGWPISTMRLATPQLSADGETLVAMQPTGAIARWRLRGSPLSKPEIEPLALAATVFGSVDGVSRTGEWVLILGNLRRRGGDVAHLASNGRARLASFPNTPKKTVFSPGGLRLAVLSCTHQVFVWDLQDPDSPPIEFANGDPIEDFRWIDDDRGEALFYDGTAMMLGGPPSVTTRVARLPCLPRAARRKYLEETSDEAHKAYADCMQGFEEKSGPRSNAHVAAEGGIVLSRTPRQ